MPTLDVKPLIAHDNNLRIFYNKSINEYDKSAGAVTIQD